MTQPASPGHVAAPDVQPVRFQIGERTLWQVERQVRRVTCTLDAVLQPDWVPPTIAHDPSSDGIDIRALPASAVPHMLAAHPDLLCLERQHYPRHYLRLDGSFDDYLAHFSAKTRSTLRRKRARWERLAGGLDLRTYHRPDQVDAFVDAAGGLSRRTYQARLLDAGLPTDAAAIAEMRMRASRGDLRAFLLFHDGAPASYLHLPVERGCILYAHLGYDPALADHSPGTVLHLAALEQLFAEPDLRLFDFTEGDGAHKRLFGTGHIDCVDLLLLRPTLANRLLALSLPRFDAGVARVSGWADRLGLKARVRRALRR